MARTIPQRELRNHNAAIVEAVARGEAFVVTRRGIPVAELRPLGSQRRRLVAKHEIAAVGSGGPHLNARKFRADLDRVSGQRLSR